MVATDAATDTVIGVSVINGCAPTSEKVESSNKFVANIKLNAMQLMAVTLALALKSFSNALGAEEASLILFVRRDPGICFDGTAIGRKKGEAFKRLLH